MTYNHTPGPWVADGSYETTATWVSGPDGKRVCTMRTCEQDLSNAMLIATAPDLLAALDAIVRLLGPYIGQGRMDAEISAARAAIAKARGE